MLHLLVQLYQSRDSAANARMLECIQRNAELDFVQRITVLSEGPGPAIQHKKLKVVPITTRATFTDFLRTAACPVQRDDETSHFAIANTDIFLSADIKSVLEKITASSTVVALTRRERDGELPRSPQATQDVWIFKNHNLAAGVIETSSYCLGIPGCENLFAASLFSHGYRIWNPCLDCNAVHNDPAPKTSWPDWYYGLFLHIPPCRVEDVESQSPKYKVYPHAKRFEMGLTKSVRQFEELSKERPVKLHLCCGDKKLEGFLGVDIRPEVEPDIVAHLENLECFPDRWASEIYFCHGLEHVSFRKTRSCLAEIFRIMKPGGKIRLALPDFEALVKLYSSGLVKLEAIRPAIHGGQDYHHNIHYASWDFSSLRSILVNCGFTEVQRYNPLDFLPPGYFDWSLHRIGGIETSLNIECLRPS